MALKHVQFPKLGSWTKTSHLAMVYGEKTSIPHSGNIHSDTNNKININKLQLSGHPARVYSYLLT